MSDEIEKKVTPKKKAPPKPKPVQRQAVRLVNHQGESALVEWHDERWHRVYIPLAEYDFEKHTVAVDVLAAGIPYGVDWSRLDLAIDPVALDDELKKRQIWTKDDLLQKPNQAIAAINKISGMMRRQMLKLAEEKGD